MKVMFVSQCTKQALVETRRIIDQFAERKGDCVWQTNITQQGLETVRKLLKASARRNTAVACHIFRGRQETELVWLVGNAKRFNLEGSVPTKTTYQDVLRTDDENDWHTGEAIAILAAIAGLFHDFGKANELFQSKLKGKTKRKYEPFRHEWISLLLFKSFVGSSSDKEWIERLSKISPNDEEQLLKNFPQEHQLRIINPFLKGLPKLAMFVGWLILSHHRLPVLEKNRQERPRLDSIDNWMLRKSFSARWNSYDCEKDREENDWEDEIIKVGVFPMGTPMRSESWCFSGRKIGVRALNYYHLLEKDWFQDPFSMHLMRATLMLSDHFYSANEPIQTYQDKNYRAYANTNKKCRTLKQKLDEHNIGVARNAFRIAKRIPKLRNTLPSIRRHKEFKKRNKDNRFQWQDKAYDLACGIGKSSDETGFFGINLASTGCGKTLANARIMYGLSDEKKGCRFSVALGLRVLTLQTGDALQEKLKLNSEDVAVMIGSREFQQLHEINKEKEVDVLEESGSESSEDLLDELNYIRYEGCLDDGPLSRWLSSNNKLHKLVSAPILVTTVDHLIPATEGCRGGKQIAPLLRLLTSDLVLDEPDDFDVDDLPALCRLVNFAGVCGSRVLLSSATLPPSIVQALFDAYSTGRKIFNVKCRGQDFKSEIFCAWFDEFGVTHSQHTDLESFMISHKEFAEKRITHLEKQTTLRRSGIIPVDLISTKKADVISGVSKSIRDSIYSLHDIHHQIHPNTGKRVSIGLVRMANIDPMISVVKSVLSEKTNANYRIHYCVYHSRFPFLVRSKIEEVLDRTLTRHNENKIWEMPEIVKALSRNSEKNHVFVVFATPVAEVGRDHDYDWAIIEPSSMRSIIQLAGRVQRHRGHSPSVPNLLILNKNIKALKGEEVAFSRPGFESSKYKLETKDLTELLLPHQFEQITAIPRLQARGNANFQKNLVDLEHTRLEAELLGSEKDLIHASLWWKHHVHWCGELQQQTPFRKKEGLDAEYIEYLEEEGEKPQLHEMTNEGHISKERDFDRTTFTPQDGNQQWIQCDVKHEIEKLADRIGMCLAETSLKFTRVRLRKFSNGERWSYEPLFGFYHN